MIFSKPRLMWSTITWWSLFQHLVCICCATQWKKQTIKKHFSTPLPQAAASLFLMLLILYWLSRMEILPVPLLFIYIFNWVFLFVAAFCHKQQMYTGIIQIWWWMGAAPVCDAFQSFPGIPQFWRSRTCPQLRNVAMSFLLICSLPALSKESLLCTTPLLWEEGQKKHAHLQRKDRTFTGKKNLFNYWIWIFWMTWKYESLLAHVTQ